MISNVKIEHSKRLNVMKTIIVTNNRGGQGKSFFAMHIAWVAVLEGKRVLLVDADKDQGNAIQWVSGHRVTDPEAGKVYNFGKLDVVYTLGGKIKTDGYDFVIIDGRPQADVISEFIKNADVVVCPFDGRLGKEAVMDVVDIINKASGKARIIAVMNRVQSERSKIARNLASQSKIQGVYEFWPRWFREQACVKYAEKDGVPVWDASYSRKGTTGVAYEIQLFAKNVLGFEDKKKEIIPTEREVRIKEIKLKAKGKKEHEKE